MARTEHQCVGTVPRGKCAPFAILFLLAATAATSAASETRLVSRDIDGGPANGDSYLPAISADARFIAFESAASDLVDGDTNSVNDIFIRDLVAQTTERISISTSGGQSNATSFAPVVSADGRFVAFISLADNLVEDDENDRLDVFVRDRAKQTTERVSVHTSGAEADGNSMIVAISADGRIVAFLSAATNLVDDDTNGYWDIFVHDRVLQITSRISVSPDGEEGNNHANAPDVSADGRYIVFESAASNLIENDTNGFKDVFMRDRQTGEVARLNVSSDGEESDGGARSPSISADGRFIAYFSDATNLVEGDQNEQRDIFLRDRTTGETTLVSIASSGEQGDGPSYAPAVSGNGRFIAFVSDAENLIANDDNEQPDVFLRDRIAETTILVSVGAAGESPDDGSATPDIDETGRRVTFQSDASNLVEDDTNGRADIFLRRLDPAADLDGDGSVNVLDLLALLGAWGHCAHCPEDLNGDGAISVLDLLLLLDHWG
jgi:Tol biopolymer transport system component